MLISDCPNGERRVVALNRRGHADMSSGKRILHIIASVNPEHGGPIEGIIQSAAILKEKGYSREIATLDPEGSAWLASCPVTVHPLGVKGSTYDPSGRLPSWRRYRYSAAFGPWLRKHADEYDVVIVNGLWNYGSFGTWLALRKSRLPYFVFTHGMLDPWFNRAYPVKAFFKRLHWLLAERLVLRDARAVLFTSEEERTLAGTAFSPYSCRERVVRYGTTDAGGDPQVQAHAFEASCPTLHGRKYLLFLSRIHEKKGCDLLIKAFADVARAYPDLDLVIAGPDSSGWRRELEKLAEAGGVSARIHWPGMLSGNAKWGAFRGAEAFVLPSHQENFGIVVAEAMACGRPVLISDKVNIWREVELSGGGMVAQDNVQGTKDMMLSFLAMSPKSKAEMGVAARAGFLRYFEADAAVTDLIKVIEEAP